MGVQTFAAVLLCVLCVCVCVMILLGLVLVRRFGRSAAGAQSVRVCKFCKCSGKFERGAPQSMGPCAITFPCFLIFLTEKQMNFAAGCIFVSSTENCTNLWCVIAFQGCVIISATILKCASLAMHLVFVLRTFEERLVCCYSSKLVRRAFVSGSRRIGPNGPKRIRAHVRRATLTAQ